MAILQLYYMYSLSPFYALLILWSEPCKHPIGSIILWYTETGIMELQTFYINRERDGGTATSGAVARIIYLPVSIAILFNIVILYFPLFINYL